MGRRGMRARVCVGEQEGSLPAVHGGSRYFRWQLPRHGFWQRLPRLSPPLSPPLSLFSSFFFRRSPTLPLLLSLFRLPLPSPLSLSPASRSQSLTRSCESVQVLRKLGAGPASGWVYSSDLLNDALQPDDT
eukprot:3063313-Rhodomonas_salina.2